jgi:hypothetical protein
MLARVRQRRERARFGSARQALGGLPPVYNGNVHRATRKHLNSLSFFCRLPKAARKLCTSTPIRGSARSWPPPSGHDKALIYKTK